MKQKRRRCKYRLTNKGKFIAFIFILVVVVLMIIATATTSSSGNDKVNVNAEGVMPANKTIYVPQPYTEAEVEMLAKTVYGEALVTYSETEMSAVVWCILNRVDADGYACGNGIEYVITFPGQFDGYSESNPVTPEIESLVRDVLDRWYDEKDGSWDVGRTLPADYLYFIGDGYTNYFTTEWKGEDYWDWSLESPYES